MPALPINGTSVAFDEAGNGPDLLLIHAGVADRRMWTDVLPAFAERFHVVAPDLRAYGDTPIPPEPFSWTADIIGLLDALAVERTHVIGVSVGAKVAIDLALARPERVERLVLVGAGINGWQFGPEMDAIGEAERSALEAGDPQAAAWEMVRAWLDGPQRGPDDVDPELRRRLYEMQLHAYAIDNEEAELSFLVDDHRAHFAEIRSPAFVLVGALDQGDMRAMAPVLAREIPGARLHELPGVAHLPPMEDPATFARVATEFLAG